MAQTIYKRQLLGQQSGVQVNMPRDTVERMLAEAGEQSFAAVGHFSRGRIDQPFLVGASKLTRYLGKPQSIRVNAQNETYVQIFDAFANGAAAAVVSRVVSAQAKNLWLVVSASGNNLQINAAENLPVNYLFAVKMADCIENGVYVAVSQDETSNTYNVVIRERELDNVGNDTASGEVLYEFSGSVNAESKDDTGESNFIADIAEKYYGDWISVEVHQNANNTQANYNAVAKKLVLFTDTGTVANTDYQKAANALGNTTLPYRYILGDSANISLINALISVAQKYNRIMVQEISGSLNPDAAVRWKNNFQYDAQGGMYVLWVWSPIKRQDPTGAAGIVQIGTVGQKIGRACMRNAVVNGFGLPKLNQPIAGKDYYLSGARMAQIYFPGDVELAALAKAHINPVLYVDFHDGSGFVWDDSLSGAKKNGISRLENAVEISQWFQERFGKYARSLLQKPMTEALRLMTRFTEDELQAAQASGWLTPSAQLSGAAYSYQIAPSERNPDDEMQVVLNIAIDGVVRRIFVSQNMYSRS